MANEWKPILLSVCELINFKQIDILKYFSVNYRGDFCRINKGENWSGWNILGGVINEGLKMLQIVRLAFGILEFC